MVASFTINQTGGAGAGTLGRSRSALWRSVEISLDAEESGSYSWTLLDKPSGSAASLSGTSSQTCTFTPDANGTYLVRLVSGRESMTRTLRVDRNAAGSRDGVWATPAFGEGLADNEGGNERGSTTMLEALYQDIWDRLAAAISGGASTFVIYTEGVASPVSGEYDNFDDALTAAQTLPGIVTLLVNGDEDPPVLPAGIWDLEHRIRLVGYSALGGGVVPLDMTNGVLRNACYLENLEFTGELSAPAFSSSSGPLDITFVRCERSDTPEGDEFFALGTGTNVVRAIDSSFSTDSTPLVTVASGQSLTVVAEQGSFFNTECFYGSAGTLTLKKDGTSVIEATNFSGTEVNHSGATRSFRFQGIAGTQSSDPADGTSWTPIGAVNVDPEALASPANTTRSWLLHVDAEVVEASAGTVQAEVRLVDASLTSLGAASTSLGGATTFPQHVSSVLTAGSGNGEVKPTSTTYVIEMRRQGGSVGDVIFVHNVFVEAFWS